jgi:hypothetical protein
MANCLCGVMPTFGQPGCYQTMGYPVKIGFQDVKDSTGASNGILPTDTLNHSFISGLINNADTSKRLMLTPSVVNFTGNREEMLTYTANNVNYKASEGNRPVQFEIIEGATPQLLGELKKLECRNIMFYGITDESQLTGNGKDANLLRGYKIEKGTFDARFVGNQREDTARIVVSFVISIVEKDEDAAFIAYDPNSTLDGILLVDLLSYVDLIPVVMSLPLSPLPTTTGFVSKIDTIYGAKYDSAVFAGGVLADFTLYNETTASSVTITSVTEAPDGTYTFVIPAQSSADVLTLTFVKLGFYASSTLSITIP